MNQHYRDGQLYPAVSGDSAEWPTHYAVDPDPNWISPPALPPTPLAQYPQSTSVQASDTVLQHVYHNLPPSLTPRQVYASSVPNALVHANFQPELFRGSPSGGWSNDYEPSRGRERWPLEGEEWLESESEGSSAPSRHIPSPYYDTTPLPTPHSTYPPPSPQTLTPTYPAAVRWQSPHSTHSPLPPAPLPLPLVPRIAIRVPQPESQDSPHWQWTPDPAPYASTSQLVHPPLPDRSMGAPRSYSLPQQYAQDSSYSSAMHPRSPLPSGLPAGVDEEESAAIKKEELMERNRLAAQRSRQRRKNLVESFEALASDYCSQNAELQREAFTLRNELDRLIALAASHATCSQDPPLPPRSMTLDKLDKTAGPAFTHDWTQVPYFGSEADVYQEDDRYLPMHANEDDDSSEPARESRASTSRRTRTM